jgi:hypothetical protein
MDNKKSHKRQFIEKWITPNDYNSQIEKELLEAIEKDNPEQFSREDMEAAFEAAQNESYWDTFEEWLTEYLNSPEYLKAKS